MVPEFALDTVSVRVSAFSKYKFRLPLRHRLPAVSPSADRPRPATLPEGSQLALGRLSTISGPEGDHLRKPHLPRSTAKSSQPEPTPH